MERKLLYLACVAVCSLALVSCSSSSSGPDDDVGAPTITDISLQDGATDVGLIERIDITFSESMDPATVTGDNILVSGRSVSGYVEYDDAEQMASFIPDTLYAPETLHQVTVSDGVTDVAGNPVEALTASFTTGPFDTDHLDDYFEPNETVVSATPIELDRRYRTLSLTDGDDDDVFEFTIAETAKVCVSWWFTEVNGISWVFGFDDATGKQYNSAGMAPSTGDSANWYHFSFLPGTYYFHTHAHSYQTGYSIYDFMLTTDDPCRDDDYEDNDFLSQAVPVSAGTLTGLRFCLYDKDFFAIDLTEGETLTASITATAGYTDDTKRVAILHPSGWDASVMTSASPTVSASHMATETGTHYVYTMLWNEYAEYDLTLTVQ